MNQNHNKRTLGIKSMLKRNKIEIAEMKRKKLLKI